MFDSRDDKFLLDQFIDLSLWFNGNPQCLDKSMKPRWYGEVENYLALREKQISAAVRT